MGVVLDMNGTLRMGCDTPVENLTPNVRSGRVALL